jgi:alpha,alpha-trehalase
MDSHSQKNPVLGTNDLTIARAYIADYWQHLTRYHPKDSGSLIGLPKPYLAPSYSPNSEFDYEELYYWDSYFMIQGLLDETHKELVLGILDNIIYLFDRFGIIPNGSRLYYTSRTQPPFLTSFIFDVYEAYSLDAEWLDVKMAVAKKEYDWIWMGTRKPNARQVHEGLSRYYDFNYLHDLAEAESGWDMTTRFNRRALDFLPVDLNSLLYKYESDFMRAALILGRDEEALEWKQKAAERKAAMDRLMWDENLSLYFDYDFVEQKRGSVESLAGFYPLWAGMVDETRAAQLVKSLSRFEQPGGLVTTSSLSPLGPLPTQWAYPNGWAPLQFIVTEGLKRYGYEIEAKRLALKWLEINLNWFRAHGVFLEKYNVVSPTEEPAKGLYPPQTGFGWTNSIFEYFCRIYIDAP